MIGARADLKLWIQRGFVKILADSATDEVLGVHMIGARAADLIGAEELSQQWSFEKMASAERMLYCTYEPLTSSHRVELRQIIKEAALAASENRPLHI